MPITNHFAGRHLVRWGIIGCGNVTEVKSGPAFRKAASSQLVAVMRRNGELAADYARRHGVLRWYDDAAALLADPEVDAVYVATPPDSHAHFALAAAAAGKPAYVEKPMARHTPECDRMVEAFVHAQLPLYVAYYRRALPRFVAVKELLERGTLGQLTGIVYHMAAPQHRAAASWRVSAAAGGGGHFLDVGSHALDLLDFFFGPLQRVQGVAANVGVRFAVEDAVTMSFATGAGVPGSASWNFATNVRDDAMRISGTDGELSFSVFGDEPLRLETEAGTEEIERPNPPHVQQPLIQTVVDDLLGQGRASSTGETARRTSAVMDRVLADYYGGRTDAFWEREAEWPGRPKSLLPKDAQ